MFSHCFTKCRIIFSHYLNVNIIIPRNNILFPEWTDFRGEISVNDYAALNIAAAQSGYVDLIDVEAFTGDEVVKTIINAAHEAGVKVIASNHDFFKTPEKEEIIRRLRMMQDFGADIPKMAVMPTCKQDVLTLLSATLEMSEKYADRPIITMSMAGTGVVSRLTGETFGSALTFGAASKASAPGQVGVHELKQVLDIIHSSLWSVDEWCDIRCYSCL